MTQVAAIIGGGVVGTHAAKIAAGMGADVTVLDRSLPRLKYLDDVFGGTFKNQYSTAGATAELIRDADMVIGAVLIPGAAAPKLISRAQLGDMKPGAVLVDVAIDQGGCFETSKATTHQDPIYDVDGVDDILETTGSEWIADAVSLTPCGPDGLLQPTADFAFDELVTGQVTVIPYFSDSMLMIVEARLRGDFGVAFITTSTLMTRD